jgi:hypothetical protein
MKKRDLFERSDRWKSLKKGNFSILSNFGVSDEKVENLKKVRILKK